MPALERVRIGEVGVGLLDRFLEGISSAAVAKRCRVVLTGMFGMASRQDAIDHNPVRETVSRTQRRTQVRAMTVGEVAVMRARVAEWAGANVSCPPRGQDLPDVLDAMLGTGARLGEVLATRKEDLDLRSNPPTVIITGTIVGNKRQPAPKTEYFYRRLILPSFVAAAFRRQLARNLPTDELHLVFPSRRGGPRMGNNVRWQLRQGAATTSTG